MDAGQLKVFSASCAAVPACTTDGWAAFVAMERAVVNPAAAWHEVCDLDDHVFAATSPAGNGNSRLNALYWVSGECAWGTRGRAWGECGGECGGERGVSVG